ncbi:hypothetical protein P154DRAFT_67240 [Amniculicola lignicola CBS 123094]|uniref:Uncharacterized protein n=1 Tax=Amniculicola lignicola CBS 123094 TaxID=1392246 RepID=A0A6A5WQI2_9PLEO|nr:hypothetical protein P154DRAFT_67240 [Amniculicola lignicola CBS 123094]
MQPLGISLSGGHPLAKATEMKRWSGVDIGTAYLHIICVFRPVSRKEGLNLNQPRKPNQATKCNNPSAYFVKPIHLAVPSTLTPSTIHTSLQPH